MNENNKEFNNSGNFEGNVNENQSNDSVSNLGQNSTSNDRYENRYENRYEQSNKVNYQQDDLYYGKVNREYNHTNNNFNDSGNINYNSNSSYNGNIGNNGETNPNMNYNEKPRDNNKTKKMKKKSSGKGKKVAVTIAAVAGTVLIAFSGGLLGGYLVNKDNSASSNAIDPNAYAAPEFLSSSEDGTLTVSEAIEKVKPAVVTISTKTIVKSNNYFQQDSVQEGIGSGFIINEEGYILTNYHVVENAQEVKVLLSTGEEVNATVVNYDAEKDLAMVKLEDGVTVPGVAELGDSDALYAGQEVIAIGTPLSTEFSATSTKGIISAINRDVETETGVTMNLIQTDAAINPGNSGGPLINSKGQVIGINSMKLVTTEVEGIGFAIPINEANSRIETLSKPIITLGISVMQIDKDTAKKNDLSVGLYVKDVTDFSPAQKAGIKIADIITEFNGKDIKTIDDLSEAKEKCEVGDKVKVKVIRDNKEVDLELTLE